MHLRDLNYYGHRPTGKSGTGGLSAQSESTRMSKMPAASGGGAECKLIPE